MLWYEKYSPTDLDQFVWSSLETKEKVDAWIADPLAHPSLLLSGPTGTGKTSMTRIIRSMLADRADIKFIPASLRSGVDAIRDEIVGFCEAGGWNDLKLIVMDESDRLSVDAQEALRNVLDRYSEDVRFIFTCNRPEKMIDPLKGRLWEIVVDGLNDADFTERLLEILDHEDVDATSDESIERLLEIARINYPNLRHAISDLQWSVIDGILAEPTDEAHKAPWEILLVEVINKFKVADARALVASMRPDEYERAYRVMYEMSEQFGDLEDEAILIIAEYLHRHSQAGLPDITLCACLIKLHEMENDDR